MGVFDFWKKATYIQQSQNNVPVWTTQKDEDYIKEAYHSIVWVYACVSQISSAVSSVPWLLYRRTAKGKLIEIDSHPILTMLNDKANPYMSSRDFFDMWSTYLAVEGKFYAEYVGEMPTQMFPIYPHYMKPIPNQRTFISGFEYRQGSETIVYKPKDVLWSKFNDVLDIYQGLSPIRAMARTIDTENESVDWNKSTLQNGAVPPGIFSITNPTPELQNKLRDEWLKRYAGSNNARISLILNADKANYQPIGLNQADMDFIEQRKFNRIEICAGYGVPTQIVGIPDGQTYSNFGEAQKAFWENTVIPKYLEHMLNKLQQDLLPKYADNLVLKYDVSGVGALKENTDKISARTIEQWKNNLITLNEARYALDMTELPNGDVFNAQLQMDIMLQGQQQTPDAQPQAAQKSLIPNADDLKKNEILIQEWKKFEDKRLPFYTKTEELVKKYFENEDKLMFEAINKSDITSMEFAVQRVLKETQPELTKYLTASFVSVFDTIGNQTFNELKNQKALLGFDLFSIAITNYIATTVAEDVKNIQATTLFELKAAIALGIANEEGIPEIARRIRNIYTDIFTVSRSRTIARTEVVSASNQANLEGAKQSGASVKKIWISTPDERTRPTHAQAGSHAPIDLDDNFDVGGSKANAPGDATLPGSERINCRCAIGYVRK